MNSVFEQLPWRVAALAGITVGMISWYFGADYWTVLERMALAVVLFFWATRIVTYFAADEASAGSAVKRASHHVKDENAAGHGDTSS